MDSPTLGAFIRAWRTEKRITQEQLAAKISVSQTTITDWERDQARPRVDALVTLADLIGVHPREMLAMPGKDHATPPEPDELSGLASDVEPKGAA